MLWGVGGKGAGKGRALGQWGMGGSPQGGHISEKAEVTAWVTPKAVAARFRGWVCEEGAPLPPLHP